MKRAILRLRDRRGNIVDEVRAEYMSAKWFDLMVAGYQTVAVEVIEAR